MRLDRLGRANGVLALGLICALGVVGCDEPSSRSGVPTRAEPHGLALGREPLQPLPAQGMIDPSLAELGRRLFSDKRLSSDGTVACASCHDLAHGGVDGRARSIGVAGHVGIINAPSVYNSGLNFAQFWDGRAPTLEAQVDGPVTNPLEMSSTWPDVVARLKTDPEIVAAFTRVGRTVSHEDIQSAIAAFERTLVTRGSPFDRWLENDPTALTHEQQAGYEVFKSVGCIACHQGANVGGNMFQRFGVIGDYFEDRGDIKPADYGRYNVTHQETDRFVFRVPSLRNVELTAPYFHDGTAKTLTDAVGVMAQYQLGRPLSDEQVSLVVAFLKSLTGPAIASNGAP